MLKCRPAEKVALNYRPLSRNVFAEVSALESENLVCRRKKLKTSEEIFKTTKWLPVAGCQLLVVRRHDVCASQHHLI